MKPTSGFTEDYVLLLRPTVGSYSRINKYEISSATAQTIVLKLALPNKQLFLISLYRSPSEPASVNFFENLTCKVDEIRARYPQSELLVVGDFNVHHKEWLGFSSSTDEVGNQAYLFTSSHDLTQIFQEPTFIPSNRDHSRNLLDLCFTSIPNAMQAIVNPQIGSSDHCLVCVKIDTAPPKTIKALPRLVWHFYKRNDEGLRKFFKGFPWDFHVLGHAPGDVDVAVDNFTKTVLFGMERFIPSSTINPKRKPKFSKLAAEAVKKKKQSFKKFKKGQMDAAEYKEIVKECKKICDREANNNIKKKAEKAAQCTMADRQFYQLVSSVTTNDTKSSLPRL